MGEQFALKWHSNYNEKYVICSKQRLGEIVRNFKVNNQSKNETKEVEEELTIDSKQLQTLTQKDPSIIITSEREYYKITWMENRTHRGIYLCDYIIQKQAPFKIERAKEELIMEISIGFLH